MSTILGTENFETWYILTEIFNCGMSNTEDKSVKSTVLLILWIFTAHKDW